MDLVMFWNPDLVHSAVMAFHLRKVSLPYPWCYSVTLDAFFVRSADICNIALCPQVFEVWLYAISMDLT